MVSYFTSASTTLLYFVLSLHDRLHGTQRFGNLEKLYGANTFHGRLLQRYIEREGKHPMVITNSNGRRAAKHLSSRLKKNFKAPTHYIHTVHILYSSLWLVESVAVCPTNTKTLPAPLLPRTTF